MRVSKTRVLMVLACLGYATLLNMSYLSVEGVVGYAAMKIRPVPAGYELMGFGIMALLVAFVLPVRLRKPSDLAIWTLFLTWLVPCLLLIYHVGELPAAEVMLVVLALTLSFLVLVGMCAGRPLKLPRIELSHRAFKGLLVLSTGSIAVAVLLLSRQTNTDPTVNFFDLYDVYARRLEARRVMEGRVLLGYGIATLGASLAPISIAYGALTRRYFYVALGLAGMLSIFLLDGTKSAVFVPVMILGFVVLARRPGLNAGLTLTGLLAGLVALSMYLWRAHENLFLSVMFVRRMIVGKATTMGAYFETFKGTPMFMGDSSLMRWVGSEPALGKAHLVGQAFGAGIEENWNGNAWAAMYGDFGIPGVLLAGLLVGLLLRVYDSTARTAPFPLVAAMAGYGAYVWGEAALATSILTYGVFVSLILLTHFGGETRRGAPIASEPWRPPVQPPA